ncbi:hypothetical protein ACFL0M_05475 [Thermodesulfobacteriota bacterium]
MDPELYNEIVAVKPYLWWWVRDKKSISMACLVAGVLSNGDMEDVLKLFQLVGRENVKAIFLKQTVRPRHNYRRQTVNFFNKVFAQDV